MDTEGIEFVKASMDDGVALECWRNSEFLMSARWYDETKRFVVTTTAAELPFDLWETFMAEARRWCPLPPTAANP
jgi:hypothetical protein